MNAVIRSAGNAEAFSSVVATTRPRASFAHRRLASQLAHSQHRHIAAALFFGKVLPAAITIPLPSQFLPNQLRFGPTIAQHARLIHNAPSRRQEERKKSSDPKEATVDKGKTGDAAEAKEESQPEEETYKSGQGENGENGEKEEGKEKNEKDNLPPPPPHGDKTPWQVFTETMSSEFQASKEWNESTKQIGAAAHQFSESESVRRAREAYEKSTGAISSTAAKAVKSTAGAIGKGATWTWDTSVMKGVRKAANVTGDAMDKATKPIRDTDVYKDVKNVIDDGSSSRYGGWMEKEERRRRRQLQQKANGTQQVMQENPDAGTNVTLHKDAVWKETWKEFQKNKVMQGFSSIMHAYDESDNPLVSTARSITDYIGGWFAENETAKVVKKFREMDPSFQNESFLEELREYILPEVLDAYVKGDTETLKLWLSASQYSVYEALTKQYLQAGMNSDGRILDIRHVDILRARLLDPGEVPVYLITCRTQEVHVYRNAKTNELAAGMEDKIQLVTYVIGVTRIAEDVNNPETRGWRLIEMQKSARDWL